MTDQHPILPGAEPLSVAGGPVGVLVLHGFTGNPTSMRGLAEAMVAAELEHMAHDYKHELERQGIDMKGKRIERENAAGIVGYYKGAQPRRPQVSVIDIQADIEETVKGLEGMA